MNRFLIFSLSVVLLAGCKGGQTATTTAPSTKTSQPKTEMSDAQRAEVTYAFFNANKEKILGNLENAAGLFSEVIRKDPNNAAAMYELANIYSEQKKFAETDKRGRLRVVASPDGRDGSVTIHADATLYAGLFDGAEQLDLPLDVARKTYVHLAQGTLNVNGEVLKAGDALKLEGENRLSLSHGQQAEVLVFDLGV